MILSRLAGGNRRCGLEATMTLPVETSISRADGASAAFPRRAGAAPCDTGVPALGPAAAGSGRTAVPPPAGQNVDAASTRPIIHVTVALRRVFTGASPADPSGR